MVKIRSGVGAKIMAEADKLLPPCCREFQDCIHNYMYRIPIKEVQVKPWRAYRERKR